MGLFVLLIAFGGQTSAQQVRLRGQINPGCATTSSSKYADIFADGNIAVQGSYNCRGAFIYDISNPENPVLRAWYNPGANQQFLEAIVVGNRGYFGSGNGGGVHIVDLSNPSSPVLLGIVNSSNGNGFNSIHEMVIHGNYLIENFNGFSSKIIKVINISNPANPVFVRDINPTESNWVHAMHIRGNRMFTSGWGSSTQRGRTEIYDITNIGTQAPTLLGFIEDPSPTISAGNSMHSSWTSEDGNFLYSCRETSGSNGPNPADLRVYNITNPAQPLLVKKISMNDLSINAVSPHNPVVMGDKLYISWYQAGVQVFDISDKANPVKIGEYDTYLPAFNREESDKEIEALTDEPWDIICGSSNLQNALPTTYNGNWAVYPFLGEDKVLAGDMTGGLYVLDVSDFSAPRRNTVSDFDGDGKTDYSTFTPNNGFWSVERSANSSSSVTAFGASTDKIVSADYDGDGKSDIGVFRPANGTWYILGSTDGFRAVTFGQNGDVPLPSDFDGDGKADVTVFRPTNGTWYVQQSMLGFKGFAWGASEDKAFVGDFDGDERADATVFRPSTGYWYILRSTTNQPLYIPFGASDDKPLVGDFDGDGRTDVTVFRPSEGNWYVLKSADNSFFGVHFGFGTDIPIPADYDGDSKTDIAVFRPSNGAWYRLNSSDNAFVERIFGQNGDIPSPTSIQP